MQHIQNNSSVNTNNNLSYFKCKNNNIIDRPFSKCEGVRIKFNLIRIKEPLFILDFNVTVETSLNSYFLSSELSFISYNIYRCDYDYNSGVSLGGGVLICIKKIFFFKCLNVPSNSDFDHLFIYVRINSKDLIIAGVYFPPK